jgi:hypothetical protein
VDALKTFAMIFTGLLLASATRVYFPLVQGGENVSPSQTPTPPLAAPPIDLDDPMRFISPRADRFTWCELQKLPCQVVEIDPRFNLTGPAGYRINSVTMFAMTNPEGGTGVYERVLDSAFLRPGDAPLCSPGYRIYCVLLKSDGRSLAVFRNGPGAPVEMIDVWLEAAPDP